MRSWTTCVMAAVALMIASQAIAGPARSCSAHRLGCESVCTPDRVARYYFGLHARCTASCEPRWQECLRTGIWVDLERRSTGWWEAAERF